jgi:hypothetical protein
MANATLCYQTSPHKATINAKKPRKILFLVLTKDFKNVILILIRKNYHPSCFLPSLDVVERASCPLKSYKLNAVQLNDS